jgi:hypothetical protein
VTWTIGLPLNKRWPKSEATTLSHTEAIARSSRNRRPKDWSAQARLARAEFRTLQLRR